MSPFVFFNCNIFLFIFFPVINLVLICERRNHYKGAKKFHTFLGIYRLRNGIIARRGMEFFLSLCFHCRSYKFVILGFWLDKISLPLELVKFVNFV